MQGILNRQTGGSPKIIEAEADRWLTPSHKTHHEQMFTFARMKDAIVPFSGSLKGERRE